MNRYNLNGIFVALESELKAVLGEALTFSLLAQPGTKRIRSETAGALRIVQKLGQVEEIGQAPFASGQLDQLGADIPRDHKVTEHRHETAVDPLLAPVRKTVQPDLAFLIILIKVKKRLRIESDQTRGQGCFQLWIATRIDHALKELLQLTRFVRDENALVALHDAADAPCAESFLDFVGLMISANEHSHVAVAQSPVADGRSAFMQGRDVMAHASAD